MFISFQDFEKSNDKKSFIREFLNWYRQGDGYRIAVDADKYDRQQNSTIMNYVRFYYSILGQKVPDKYASNNKIASNFFHRLNTQRCTYSLGNGLIFSEESTKEKLGKDFDTRIYDAVYKALIHGVSFVFWNLDHIHVFPATEFAPLWDEETGALRAGVRYWQLDPEKPEFCVLYEEDGYTKYKAERTGSPFVQIEEKRAYRQEIRVAPADEEPEVIAQSNYNRLPIIPVYGTKQKQSTLIGMKNAIDSFDLIRSGFANDLEECAQIYWIISNADAMTPADLAEYRARLKFNHIAQADEGDIHPFTQEIPYNARSEYLKEIRSGIYEDYGGLDVHAVAAGATNDHIDAAYQPMDENADDLEYCVIDAVQSILALIDIADTPVFKRNRISNQREQVDMIVAVSEYLDEKTVLQKLPFITPDEVDAILAAKDIEDFTKFTSNNEPLSNTKEDGNE